MAFIIITGIGVLLGHKILKVVPGRFLQIGAAAIFILLGLIQIINVLFKNDIPQL